MGQGRGETDAAEARPDSASPGDAPLPVGRPPAASRLGAVFASMAIGAAVFALFPTMSDADFVVYDPVLHGASLDRVLESGNDPAGILTHPNHPLFHQLTYLIARPLRSLEVERPALVASRILNGIGMAVIVLVISSLAGPRRWLVGFGFALLAIACRGVILDAGTGENIIPGAAAALLALRLASGAGSHPRVLVFTILVALLLRQDNLFIVPGCLLAHAMKNPAGRRLRSAMVVAFAAGTLTLAAYAIIYALCPWDRGFIDFLLGLGARLVVDGGRARSVGFGGALRESGVVHRRPVP